MSITRQNARAKVRTFMRDRDPSDYIFPSPEINVHIESTMRTLAGQAKLGQEWTTLAVTTATDIYAMPGSAEYAQVLEVRRQVDGYPLEIVSRETMANLRAGDIASIPSRGRPHAITLWEDPSQVLYGRVFPTPDASYTLDVLRSTLPAALATDDAVIPFDSLLTDALCYRVASELLLSMPKEQAAKRLVDARTLAMGYAAKADALVAEHRLRRNRQRAVGTIRRERRR